MAFDGITLHTIVDELQLLNGAKVNSIYEPTPNNIVISVYKGSTFAINIDTTAVNYRIHLTNHTKPNPIQAPNFCMTLRKYLGGSKINRIYMNGLERICYIEFSCFNEMNDKVFRTLVIELMGKYSNVILLNENKNILDALKKFDSTNLDSRSIMPARKYIEPLDTKKDITSVEEKDFVSEIMNSEYKTLDTAIPSIYTGISKGLINSIIQDLKITNTVSKKSLEEIFKYIQNILNKSRRKMFKKFEDNYSITLNNALNWEDEYQVNFDMDEFYYYKSENELFINYRNNLLRLLGGTLDKLIKKLDNINKKIKSCEDMDKYQLYGELLIANIYRFKDLKSYENVKEVEVQNYYDENNEVKIKIDSSLSIQDNAEKYFKKYNKMKNTLRVTQIQKEQTNRELKYLETVVEELDRCEDINDVDDVYNEIAETVLFSDLKNKKITKKKSKDDSTLDNYMKFNIDGYDVFVGKNNKQNDYLTVKVANDNDFWFHTKDIHGSHLILKSNGEMPKIDTIRKCGEIAAYYSKARFSSHVPVDYALRKFVKKPNGSAPGYVIYTTNKTIFVEPNNNYGNEKSVE